MSVRCTQRLLPEVNSHIAEWSVCTKCSLSQGRTNSAFYRGSVPCKLLFIGDAPDDSATSSGLPFSGPTAEILDAYVPSSIGQDWAVTYGAICGGSSTKLSTVEMDLCWTRLISFIGIASPQIVCTLGKFADSVYIRHMNDVISKLNRRPLLVRVNSPIYVLQAKDRVLEVNKARLHIEGALERLEKK